MVKLTPGGEGEGHTPGTHREPRPSWYLWLFSPEQGSGKLMKLLEYRGTPEAF